MRVILLVALLGSTFDLAADEPMRCGNSLVTSANTVEELVAKCGEPKSREIKTEDIKAGVATGAVRTVGTTTVETWIYQSSSQSVPRVVTIVDGVIKRIEIK